MNILCADFLDKSAYWVRKISLGKIIGGARAPCAPPVPTPMYSSTLRQVQNSRALPIYRPFSILLKKIPLCRPKIITRSWDFQCDFFPCLVALLIAHSTHRAMSIFTIDAYSITTRVLCHVVDLKHRFDTCKVEECFILQIRKHWNTCWVTVVWLVSPIKWQEDFW